MKFELEEELIEILKRDGKKLCMYYLHKSLSDFEKFELTKHDLKKVDDVVYEEYGYRPSLVVEKEQGFMATASVTEVFYLGVNIVVRGANPELQIDKQ